MDQVEETKVEAQPTEAPAEKEAKEASRTQKFQDMLKVNFGNILGIKVSRDAAWKLYKEAFDSTVAFLVQDEEHRLPLTGIGTWAIKQVTPRKPVNGQPSRFEGISELPRMKYKPSDRYKTYIFDQYGIKPTR